MKSIISIAISIIGLTTCNLSRTPNPNFEIETIAVGKGASSVEIADFNKDGRPDIAIANTEDNKFL